jgi:hypothetical protein
MRGIDLKNFTAQARAVWRGPWPFAREALHVVVALRAGFMMLAVLAWFLFPKNTGGAFAFFTQPDFDVWHNRMLGMWSTWDASWYMQIAERGYLADVRSLAFFPLYPALVGVAGRLLGGGYLAAGLLISTALTGLALTVLHRLVAFDFDARLARRTVLYLCVFPVAFYLFAVYTEALFMALVLLCFLAMRVWRAWWWAGLFAALAALTRGPGALLIIPLAWEWGRLQWLSVEGAENQSALWRARVSALLRPAALAIALPLLAVIGWGLYQQVILNVPADAALQAQAYWQRSFEWPWVTVIDSLKVFFAPGANGLPVFNPSWDMPDHLLDATFLVTGLVLLLAASWECWQRRLPLSYLLYMAPGMLLPLLTPVLHQPALSYPRFSLVLFPIFILLARSSWRARWWYYTSVYVSLTLQGLLFMRFANGFWVA